MNTAKTPLLWVIASLLSFFSSSARSGERFILPDSFSIAAYDGVPQIQLTRNAANSYVAKINFKASYERIARYIIETEPDALISELTITPTSIKTVLNADSSLFLKAYSMTPATGGMQLKIEFTSAMDETAVLRFLRTLNIFGFADANVTCPSGSTLGLCGAKLFGVPLYNQYREIPDRVADDAARRLFLINNRKFELLLSDPMRFRTFADLEAYIADLISAGCKSASGSDVGFCETIRPFGSFTAAVRSLAYQAFGDRAGEELGTYILSPEQVTGHQGQIVRFEMRDINFPWPGSVWTQIMPEEYPNFWSLDLVDQNAPESDAKFAEDFYLSKFYEGFIFTDRADQYGFGTGGFSGMTNIPSGEAFRLSGISKGQTISGRISIRFALRDEADSWKPFLEISSRKPGDTNWTALRIARQPEGTPNTVIDTEAIYTIKNLTVPEGYEVMMRFVVPSDISRSAEGQRFTLYQAEVNGIRCPLEVFQKYPQHCK